MTHGRPVVAAQTGAIGSLVVDGRNGLAVSPGDPDAIAGALIWLARSRQRMMEMGRAAKQDVQRTVSWSKQAEKFLSMAERIADVTSR